MIDAYGHPSTLADIRERFGYAFLPHSPQRGFIRPHLSTRPVDGVFDIGPVRVVTRYLNHPCLTLGYRLEAAGVNVVYATDHEPHGPPDPSGGTPVHPEDRRHIEFLQGAGVEVDPFSVPPQLDIRFLQLGQRGFDKLDRRL